MATRWAPSLRGAAAPGLLSAPVSSSGAFVFCPSSAPREVALRCPLALVFPASAQDPKETSRGGFVVLPGCYPGDICKLEPNEGF